MHIIILDHLFFLQEQLSQVSSLKTFGSSAILQDFAIDFTPDEYSVFKFCWFPDQFTDNDPINYKLVREESDIPGLTYRLSCSRLALYKVSPTIEDLLNIQSCIDNFRDAYKAIQAGQDPNVSDLPTWMVCVVLHWKFAYQNTYTLDDLCSLTLSDNLSRTFAYVSMKQQLSHFIETQKLTSLP